MKKPSSETFSLTDYQCPRTGKLEHAKIKHTTVAQELMGRDMLTTNSVVISVVAACSGLETCGVKTTINHLGGGSASSFSWSLCPLNTTLKTG